MELFIHWAGFIGAWLLVAGPLYQAAIELSEDASQSEDIRETFSGAPVAEKVPLAWWLFPPAYYLKRRAASKKQRAVVFRLMTSEQRERTMIFVNKAGGWMVVAAGAFLIALKETWELAGFSHWPNLVFWVLAFVLAIVSVWNAGVRIRRSRGILEAYAADDAAPGAAQPDARPDST